MEPSYGHPDRRDDRKAWLPLMVVGALVVVLFLVAVVLFGGDGTAEPAGTLPSSFPDLTVPPTTPPTTPPATPATAAPAATAPPAAVVPPTSSRDRGGGGRTTTTVVGSPNPDLALEAFATQAAATDTSDIVPIGSDLFAMIVVSGNGKLLRWNDKTWTVADEVNPPGPIRSVTTADVTGDGTRDFLIGLGGLARSGGVYSRQTFQFGFLPFNTVNGTQDFVDGLEYRLGKLQSPFRDASGSRTLTWTWTGRMFETS